MAECHGLWRSWIDPESDYPDLPDEPSDGILFADQEDNLGNFIGAHLFTFDRLIGQCVPPVNTPHTLIITRIGQGRNFHYHGDVTEDPIRRVLVARGRRSRVVTDKGRPEVLPDDEVWIAVKTT